MPDDKDEDIWFHRSVAYEPSGGDYETSEKETAF